MERPVDVTARSIDLPDSMRELVEERARRLERYYPELVGCSVTVEGPGRHRRTGGPFSVQLDLRVPNAEPIVVTRQRAEELPVAIRESFDAARRRLEDFARQQRGDVKRHEPQPTGRVSRLFPEAGYGFIRTDEVPAREIYFHRNSLLGAAFETLAVGAEVRFHEEAGAEGPQASTVTVTDLGPGVGPTAAEALAPEGIAPTVSPEPAAQPASRPLRIRDLMTRDPATCSPGDSLASALVRMWETDCGVLPVVADGRTVGVVTDRDVAMALLFQAAAPGDVPVRTLLRGTLRVCAPDDDVATALETMATHQVRRLPVTENDRLVGILSMNDLVLAAGATRGPEQSPTYGDVVKALQGICRRRLNP